LETYEKELNSFKIYKQVIMTNYPNDE